MATLLSLVFSGHETLYSTKRKPLGPSRLALALPFLVFALLGHLALLTAMHFLLPVLVADSQGPLTPPTLVILQPAPESETDEDEEIEEPEEPELDGQVVEIAPPELEEAPEEAEYLAEHNSTVEEETKTLDFEVNPEVVANEHSEEARYETEDLLDLNVDKPSTGATVGNDRFEPDRDGVLASLPSRWRMTNQDGPQDPVPWWWWS